MQVGVVGTRKTRKLQFAAGSGHPELRPNCQVLCCCSCNLATAADNKANWARSHVSILVLVIVIM